MGPKSIFYSYHILSYFSNDTLEVSSLHVIKTIEANKLHIITGFSVFETRFTVMVTSKRVIAL